MKTFLLYADRDADAAQVLPWNAADLIRDLGLKPVIDAMTSNDRFLPEVVTRSLLNGLREAGAVLYRQSVMRDCIANADPVRRLYTLASNAIEGENRNFWGMRIRHAASILRRSRDVLGMFCDVLVEMRALADGHGANFESDGFKRFFSMLQTELDDEYIAQLRDCLRRVEFEGGMLMSAALGRGNHGRDYVLRDYKPPRLEWFERLLPSRKPGYTYTLHPRDESGARALSELEDRGINLVADALAQSVDHILAFFTTMRYELGFYVACLNLSDKLAAKGEAICFPSPSSGAIKFAGLYDAGLSLTLPERVVANDCDAGERPVIVITGANQGGKSTFLRSLGLSQLMMECGMFVAAESFEAPLSSGIYTHFKREEDAGMESGKFDEELRRMNSLSDRLKPGAFVLFNESFAATNDREGSEIARQIAEALLDSGVRVAFVTHLYEFAYRLLKERRSACVFLRAERGDDGGRTFRLSTGDPLPTSFGEDIYRRIFSEDAKKRGCAKHLHPG